MTGLVIEDPTALAVALRSKYVIPGDRLRLRAGTYTGDFTCTLPGTEANPILIEPYAADEHVIIDGGLRIEGSYTYWQNNLELRYSGWTTRIGDPQKYLHVYGPGTKIINCTIHDFAIVGFWTPAINGEWYGNAMYNIGCIVDGTGYGHSIYTQNQTGRKIIKHNVMCNPFNWNIQIYSTGNLANYDIIENTSFNSGKGSGGSRDGIIIGGEGASYLGMVMNGNLTYNNRVGYLKYGGLTPVVEMSASNNYFPDGWAPANTQFMVNENNTLGVVGNVVFVYPNTYANTRANVTIYNEAGANTVSVDLSSVAGLNIGDTVNVHNVQDYYTDIQSLVLDADKKITINMQAINHTVVAPYQWDAPATTFPTFGAFVVEKA